MTGIIRKSEDIMQGVGPYWTTMHVVPRGNPKFPDKTLHGTARYALKVGSYLPNIQPDNRATLLVAAQPASQTLQLDRVLDGMAPGALIKINSQELQQVYDVDQDTKTLKTTFDIQTEYDAGTPVDLFAEPYRVVGAPIGPVPAFLLLQQSNTFIQATAILPGSRGNSLSFRVNVPTEDSAFIIDATPSGISVTAEVIAGVTQTTWGDVVTAVNALPAKPFTLAITSGPSTQLIERYGPLGFVGGADAQLTVRGRFDVLLGDKLWIQSDPALLLSGAEYTVSFVFANTTSLSLRNTVIGLDSTLPASAVIADDSVVYLRAYPAYKSLVVNVPNVNRAPYPLGPFVLDYVSGSMNDRPDQPEFLSVQTFDVLGMPIDPYPRLVPKNTPIIGVPIHQSAFLFFNVHAGTCLYRNQRLLLRTDEFGKCMIWTDLLPGWTGPFAWQARMRFISGSSLRVRYQFFPNDVVEAGFGGGGISKNLTFEIPGGVESTRMLLIVQGEPNGEIEMDGWNVVRGEVAKVQYGVVAERVGRTDWQANSIQLKPYFKTIADLRTQLDTGTRLDSGTLFL